jgi:hypothetical protein
MTAASAEPLASPVAPDDRSGLAAHTKAPDLGEVACTGALGERGGVSQETVKRLPTVQLSR